MDNKIFLPNTKFQITFKSTVQINLKCRNVHKNRGGRSSGPQKEMMEGSRRVVACKK